MDPVPNTRRNAPSRRDQSLRERRPPPSSPSVSHMNSSVVGNTNQQLPKRTPLGNRSTGYHHESEKSRNDDFSTAFKPPLPHQQPYESPLAKNPKPSRTTTTAILRPTIDKENTAGINSDATRVDSTTTIANSLPSTPMPFETKCSTTGNSPITSTRPPTPDFLGASSPWALLSWEMQRHDGRSLHEDVGNDESLLVSPVTRAVPSRSASVTNSDTIATTTCPLTRSTLTTALKSQPNPATATAAAVQYTGVHENHYSNKTGGAKQPSALQMSLGTNSVAPTPATTMTTTATATLASDGSDVAVEPPCDPTTAVSPKLLPMRAMDSVARTLWSSHVVDRVASTKPASAKQQVPPEATIMMERESDEWAEKQVHTFVTWLNHIFYPNHVKDEDASLLPICFKAPSLAKRESLSSRRLQRTELRFDPIATSTPT
jgi:hypothetical protein